MKHNVNHIKKKLIDLKKNQNFKPNNIMNKNNKIKSLNY